jgi:transglutaminase-like putative cysteine protease
MHRPSRNSSWLLLAAVLLLAGCASRYFHSVGPPPAEPVRHALVDLNWREYWTGIIFNGDKVGFTHTRVMPVPDEPGRYEIHSEASLLIRLLGFGKKIQLRARDVVNDDLTLVRFDYDYNIDGNTLQLSGTQDAGRLQATIRNAGRASEQHLQTTDAVYPASVVALFPVVNGLKLGAEHRYQIYSGETQSLLDVRQRVEAYEGSDLFLGNAFKVQTFAVGNNATTWIDESGKPVLELALNGVMISALEGESEAKRYLTLAALNKRDTLIDFSLVKPDRPIPDPRRTTNLRIAMTGAPSAPRPTPTQRCERSGDDWLCDIRSGAGAQSPRAQTSGYLQPSVTVPSEAHAIRTQAHSIVGDASTAQEQIPRLLAWIQSNIERVPVDTFSALDVLQTKQAECQGHAYLYTAFARSLGIPTRVVNGLVYSEQFKGFLYHSWSESLVDDRWQPVDPTFGQADADATHIGIVEGESAADLLPLIDWVGKVRIRVLVAEPSVPAARH